MDDGNNFMNKVNAMIDNLSTISSKNNSHSKAPTTRLTSLFSAEEENFGSNALFLFKQDNKFRIMIQKMIAHKAFVITLHVIIGLNVLFLILETVLLFYFVCYVAKIMFTTIYTVEFFLKIIAYGFVIGEHTYLRDPWNFLDFIILLTTLISLIPDVTNDLSAIRVFRLLRPLKAISMFPKMKRFINALLSSLIDISSVLLLMMFIFVIFAITGLSLWNDRFSYRCRTVLIPEKGNLKLDQRFYNRLCGGTNKCSIDGKENLDYCLSEFNFDQGGEYFISKAYGFGEEERNIQELNYGITTFQDIFRSLLIVFITTTGEGWVRIMNIFMDGHNYYISLVYFIMCVIVNYYFMLNLTVAVLLYNFEKIRLCDEMVINKRKLNHKNLRRIKMVYTVAFQEKLSLESAKAKYKKRYELIKTTPVEVKREMASILSKSKSLKKFHCFEIVEPRYPYHYKFYPGFICYYIYQQPFVQIIFYCSIVINTIVLSMERVGMSQLEVQILYIINIILVALFGLELLILILGIGFKRFIKDFLNILDAIIVISSIIELSIKNIMMEFDSISLISVFRVFRLLKIVKLFRIWQQFQNIIICVKETIKRVGDFIILFFIIWFTFALLGFSLFNNSLRFDPNTFRYKASEPLLTYNFSSFHECLISVLIIIVGDHWNTILYHLLQSDKNNWSIVIVYFVSLVIIGQIILMNVFLAYLTDNYQKAAIHLAKNIKVKEFIYSSEYQTYQLHQIEEASKVTDLQRSHLVLNVYLNKFKRKQIANQGKLICIEMKKIDFITNTVEQHTDFQNQKKQNKFIKEIYLDSLKKSLHKRTMQECEIDSYTFMIDYHKISKLVKKNKRRNSERPELFKVYSTIGGEINHLQQSQMLFNIDESESSSIVSNDDLSDIAEISHDDEDYKSFSKQTTNNLNQLKNSNRRRSSLFKSIKGKLLKQSSTFDYPPNKSNIIIDPLSELSSESSRSFNKIQTKNKEDFKELGTTTTYAGQDTPLCQRIIEHCRNSSLFIFHRDWKITILIHKLVNTKEFHYTIFALILISIIVLCFDTPWLKPGSNEQYCIVIFNYFFNIIFLFEGLLKIISDGFICRPKTEIKLSLKGKEIAAFEEIMNEIGNPNMSQNFSQSNDEEKMLMIKKAIEKINKQTAYIRDPFNMIDFFCIVIGLIDISGLFHEIRYLRVLRVIRSIKPIRIFVRSYRLNLLIRSISKSIITIGHIMCLVLLFIAIFSISGLNLFKNHSEYYCDNNYSIRDKETCYKHNGHWVFNYSNYSNILYSMKSNFEIMMGDGWSRIMEVISQITGTKWVYLYFVILVLLGNIVILNLFVSVLIERFRKVKMIANDLEQLSEPEKEWVNFQKTMMRYDPVIKLDMSFKQQVCKERLNRFIFTKWFEHGVTALVFLSTISLLIQYEGASDGYLLALEIFNYFFTLLFNVEIGIKLYVIGKTYFVNNWNKFDFTIIIFCDVIFVANLLSYIQVLDIQALSALPIILRLFRIFRIFRIFSTFKQLRVIVNTLLLIFPGLANVSLVIVIILIIYANIAMNIFGTVPYRSYIDENNNFRDFLSSLQVLFQITTGEDWNILMNELAYHDCRNSSSPEFQSDYYCVNYGKLCYDDHLVNYTTMVTLDYYSCGSNFSYVFFISFMIVGPVFSMSLCVVMVVESFSDLMSENEGILTEEYMTKMMTIWGEYDRKGKKMILPHEFVLLIKELVPPFGYNYDRYILTNPFKLYQERQQHLLFKDYLEELSKNEEVTDINFNDDHLFTNNLPYAYEFKTFYLSSNKNFYTTDLEVLKILNKFDLRACEDNTGIKADRTSFTFINHLAEDPHVAYKDFYIHFIDACISISRLIVSKLHSRSFESLRKNLVNSYTVNLWSKYYNFQIIKQILISNNETDDLNLKASQLLSKTMYMRVKDIFHKKAKDLDFIKKKESNNILKSARTLYIKEISDANSPLLRQKSILRKKRRSSVATKKKRVIIDEL